VLLIAKLNVSVQKDYKIFAPCSLNNSLTAFVSVTLIFARLFMYLWDTRNSITVDYLIAPTGLQILCFFFRSVILLPIEA